ncbi:SsrA-binding protein SmpB [Patescibacteria group bacterium]|nr:SsrA-binding protein SmpB [Patescibacteria group bacterium]
MKIPNKRARYEYSLESDRFEAGLVLSGGEAKAIRTGHADLTRSVARILNGEGWLINANIPFEGAPKYNPTRSRKLLLHKQEITSILTKMKQRRLTLVPVSLYTTGRLIKLALALGKPKRQFEKKEAIKRKDIQRDIERELKG